jgi:uncharacterized protein (TIGR00255 family)
MKSMTGFGRGAATGENFSVTIDIKTVNNRFLDVHLRVGAEMASVEAIIRRRISEQLARGRVDVSLSVDRSGACAYELNRPMIAGFIEALRLMQNEFQLAGEPDINMLARLPGVIQPVRDSLSDEMVEAAARATDEALAELDRMRSTEGEALRVEMSSRLDNIEASLPIIEAVSADLTDAARTRLQKRISELLARANGAADLIEIDQSRLAQEVAYLADRSDITEEITRMRSHVAQFRTTIDADGEAGKRLDFLLQEMNRESNTMLSKATDLTIKDAALQVKAEIEKLREQVQNVE